MKCKCGEDAVVEHRGEMVCKACRRAGLQPRYENLQQVRREKAQEGVARYWQRKRMVAP